MIGKQKYYVLAFLEGWGVLTVELLGAKMLAPFYGSSIFVWTLVIGITLLCLTLGYYLGSRLATRVPNDHTLYRLFLMGAFFLALMPSATSFLFNAFSSLNIFVGVAFSTFLLLGPPLIALGATTPILIQRIVATVEEAGKVAGNVYAISTIGGIVSTFLLGFWIIPAIGISWPVLGFALLLCLLLNVVLRPAPWWRRIALSCTLLLPLALELPREQPPVGVDVIYEEEGILGQLKVIDIYDSENDLRARKMLVNGIPQTNVSQGKAGGRSFFNYVHQISSLASMKPLGARALICGMGGGSLLMEFARLGFVVDAVDIDGRQLDLATEYFSLDPKVVNFHIDDARHFIHTTKNRYDIIVLDLLVAEGQPEHLFSLEAFQMIREKLQENGLLLMNFQGFFTGPEGVAARSIFRTLKAAGFHTYALLADGGAVADVIFIASPQPVDFSRITPARINACCIDISHTDTLAQNPTQFLVTDPDLSDTYLLRDDQPILDMLRLRTILEFRRTKIRSLIGNESGK